MTTQGTAIDEIIENFSLLDEWDDRYRYLIELGRGLAPLPESDRNDINKVQGCASQVWLSTSRDGAGSDGSPVLTFVGDSDALIVNTTAFDLSSTALSSIETIKAGLSLATTFKINQADLASGGPDEKVFAGCAGFTAFVGIGLMLGRRPLEGNTNAAGEIGHTLFRPGGRMCPCGEAGHFEAYCGGRAITERAKWLLNGAQFPVDPSGRHYPWPLV